MKIKSTGIWIQESANVEPGGFELTRTTRDITCRHCGGHAEEHWEERAEGSLNVYRWTVCQDCGRVDGDPPGQP